jgi:hypothetical protein
MQVTELDFICEWCGRGFIRPHLRGRRPLYCARACRQRAFEERRRGAFVVGLPHPTLLERLHPEPKNYQAGMGGEYMHVAHALRPDGCADRIGWRPSLCGVRVSPANRPFYAHAAMSGNTNCITCTRVAERFPLERRIDPLSDIGTATALIGTLRATRRAPDAVLRHQVDQLLGMWGAPAGAALIRRRAGPSDRPGVPR